jgi:hypothetical protein
LLAAASGGTAAKPTAALAGAGALLRLLNLPFPSLSSPSLSRLYPLCSLSLVAARAAATAGNAPSARPWTVSLPRRRQSLYRQEPQRPPRARTRSVPSPRGNEGAYGGGAASSTCGGGGGGGGVAGGGQSRYLQEPQRPPHARTRSVPSPRGNEGAYGGGAASSACGGGGGGVARPRRGPGRGARRPPFVLPRGGRPQRGPGRGARRPPFVPPRRARPRRGPGRPPPVPPRGGVSLAGRG